jgi:NADPH:quinone reductase-like Zn-dependent oxidoreductase
MHASGDQLREITALIDSGAVRPIVGKSVAFDEVPEAVGALEQGGFRGKAVLSIT